MKHEPSDILKHWEKLKHERFNFDSQWQDIADLVMPNRAFTTEHYPGEERRTEIFDNTAGEAHDRLVGQIYGLLTNPAIRWFELGTDQGEPSFAVRRWLADVRDAMANLLALPQTNFYPALGELFDDLTGFGTGAVYMDMKANMFRFRATPLPSIWVEEDATGLVDTVYRCIKLTPRQAAEMFGYENLGQDMQSKYESGSTDQEEYLHVIGPRTDHDPYKIGPKNKAFYSIVIACKDKSLVHEGGFDDFPFLVPRWKKACGERYGRGPGMIVLQEIRMVNAMARSALVAAEKQADPPVQMPDSGFMGPVRLGPSGINYYRMSAGGAKIEPINTGARADIAEGLIDRHRESIRRGFFNDLFELPQLDRMTATEVMQRQQERMQMFSPTLIRLYNELLDPAIKMTYKYLARKGRLPKPPPELDGVNLKVNYVSPLARSQKASEPGGFAQWLAAISPLANINPEVLDLIHPDRMGSRLAAALSVPEQGMRTEQELAELRQARVQQAQQQQEMQMAQSMAAAAKDGAGAIRELNQV